MAREASLKKKAHELLKELHDLNQLYFDRLNSGMIMTSYGGKKLPVHLCREGTADYFYIQDGITTFLELKGDSTTKKSRKEKQQEFADKVRRQGARYYRVKDMDTLREILGV